MIFYGVEGICIAAIGISIILVLIVIYYGVSTVTQIIKKERKFGCYKTQAMISIVFVVGLWTIYALCLYELPKLLFNGLPWGEVLGQIRMIVPAMIAGSCAVILFSIYYVLIIWFPKSGEKLIFPLSILTIASGLGYSLIMLIITKALSDTPEPKTYLSVYFIMSIAVYISGQRIIRAKMIDLANEMVYQKRTELVSRILNTSFNKFESIENEKIFATLNNDTEVISDSVRDIVTVITSVVALVFCFIYLGFMNIKALALSIVFILCAVCLQYSVNNHANKIYEQTRDIQNVFFKFINDLVLGFKELSLHKQRKRDFKKDFEINCYEYKVKRSNAELLFSNGYILGQLLIYFVIGASVFLFPVLLSKIQMSTIRNYVFIFMFMVAPISNIIDLMPRAIRTKISWNRITKMMNELPANETDEKSDSLHSDRDKNTSINLELKCVQYEYKRSDGENFKVGPINYSFKSGEIIFITGGNGSGKTTLAKLITGLYTCDSGEILMNGKRIKSGDLGDYFSTVFSDFYIFEKLYGIQYENRDDDIDKYLEILKIKDKLSIKDGVLSTTKLSTGQRKRLALLISYIDDRPIYLFDEWAADQDPEFRNYFYTALLPEMKSMGKCVIAITHDDRYFYVADKVIKMDMGTVTER